MLTGRGASDCLAGGAGKDKVRGNGGNDVLTGNGGSDLLDGGGGHDRLNPGGGKDEVDSGGGDDRVNSVDGKRDTGPCVVPARTAWSQTTRTRSPTAARSVVRQIDEELGGGEHPGHRPVRLQTRRGSRRRGDRAAGRSGCWFSGSGPPARHPSRATSSKPESRPHRTLHPSTPRPDETGALTAAPGGRGPHHRTRPATRGSGERGDPAPAHRLPAGAARNRRPGSDGGAGRPRRSGLVPPRPAAGVTGTGSHRRPRHLEPGAGRLLPSLARCDPATWWR